MDLLHSPGICNTPENIHKRSYVSSPLTPRPLNHSKKCKLSHGINQADVKPGMEVYALHPDSHLWVKGQISDVTPGTDSVSVQCKQEMLVISRHDVAVLTVEQDLEAIRDLTTISPLSTPAVLECLLRRYDADKIYTGAGSTLVVINPYKECPGLYGDQAISEYHCRKDNKETLCPHIYQTAQAALRGLSYGIGKSSHSIIVSGESGAGKTVSAKHVMKYLVTVANCENNRCRSIGSRIEQRILDSNPILEAFGNATTLRNHNSSRFGKYIQLQFNKFHEIEGATIQTYLLEKTRVSHQADGEYNFHILYQLLEASSDPEIQGLLDLEPNIDPRQHFTIAQAINRNAAVDKQDWVAVRDAFVNLGFSMDAHRDICKLLCVLLHLGNIVLTTDADDEELAVFEPDCAHSVSVVCRLLGVEHSKLEQTMTHKRISATHRRRQSVFHRPCTPDQATSRKDCLAKLLYSRLFEWLVTMINQSIAAPKTSKAIGILDIYGFESFTNNSLEQLCINYANEKLQQHYVVHFLKDLQTDYAREAIPWTFTEFQDNRQCLDLLENNPGLFALLDEECELNRPSNDEELCARVLSALSTSTYITRARRTNTQFIIKHYAENVQYNIDGIIDKNKDDIPPELIELLQQSAESFVSELFSEVEATQPAGGKKKKCVLAKFKSSLDRLMLSLEHTEPHYVRCIKPNPEAAAGRLDQTYLLRQLQACGIIETVEISRQAFPARLSYEEFLQRYGLVLRARQLPGEKRPSSLDDSTTMNSSLANKENELLFEPLDLLYRKQLNMSDRCKSSATPKKRLRRRADDHGMLIRCDLEKGLSSADHTRKLSASIMCLVFGNDYTDQPTCSQFGKTKIFLKNGQLERLEGERTRVLAGHSFTIQCAWRRHQTRKHRHKVRAITHIQAVVRSWRVRQWLRRRAEAARTIQRSYRTYILHKQHEEVVNTDTILPVFSTPRSSSRDEQSVINCSSPRIGAIVSNACLDQAARLDATPPDQRADHTPYYTPVTSRKPETAQRDMGTPRIPRNKFTICGFQTPPTYPGEGVDKYLVENEKSSDGMTYHIVRSPHPAYPGSKPMSDVFRNVASAISAAFLTQRRFHLSGAFNGIPYFEAHRGIVSRRRLPRVQIKFHTRANTLLKYGHYIHQRELQCSMADCLNAVE